ncbi:unnamed protein product, partial [Lymnaea stagnalis]
MSGHAFTDQYLSVVKMNDKSSSHLPSRNSCDTDLHKLHRDIPSSTTIYTPAHQTSSPRRQPPHGADAQPKIQIRSTFRRQDAESQRTCHPWRNKGRRKLYRLGVVFLVYILGIVLITGYRVANSRYIQDKEHQDFTKDINRFRRDTDEKAIGFPVLE